MSRLEVRREKTLQDYFRESHARLAARKAALAAADNGEPTMPAELKAIELRIRAHLNSGPKVRALIEAVRAWAEAEELDPARLRRLRVRLDELDNDDGGGGHAA